MLPSRVLHVLVLEIDLTPSQRRHVRPLHNTNVNTDVTMPYTNTNNDRPNDNTLD